MGFKGVTVMVMEGKGRLKIFRYFFEAARVEISSIIFFEVGMSGLGMVKREMNGRSFGMWFFRRYRSMQNIKMS